jgi:hypothetical protein
MEETFESLIINAGSVSLNETRNALINQNYVNDLTKSINDRIIVIINSELNYRSNKNRLTFTP